MSDKPGNKSSDDSSDDEYVPPGETEVLSEEEDSGDSEPAVDDAEPIKKKRRVKDSPPRKETVDKKKEVDINAVWQDFKKDVSENPKSVTKPQASKSPLASISSKSKQPAAGGLASVLGKMGKPKKLSTLEQSKQDWVNFKKQQGIEEEIEAHNKGKDGFLEKRDFLERTDLRQFEIEKKLREIKRARR